MPTDSLPDGSTNEVDETTPGHFGNHKPGDRGVTEEQAETLAHVIDLALDVHRAVLYGVDMERVIQIAVAEAHTFSDANNSSQGVSRALKRLHTAVAGINVPKFGHTLNRQAIDKAFVDRLARESAELDRQRAERDRQRIVSET